MIKKHRQRIESVTYSLFFQRKGDFLGSGYAFTCDENGKVAEQYLNNENYLRCVQDSHKFSPPEVQEQRHFYNEPAIAECVCGEEVVLHGFTNTCDACQRDYNMSGQLLAPREQWGEETGEHWTECVNPVWDE